MKEQRFFHNKPEVIQLSAHQISIFASLPRTSAQFVGKSPARTSKMNHDILCGRIRQVDSFSEAIGGKMRATTLVVLLLLWCGAVSHAQRLPEDVAPIHYALSL
jgi:hypothetical protein